MVGYWSMTLTHLAAWISSFNLCMVYVWIEFYFHCALHICICTYFYLFINSYYRHGAKFISTKFVNIPSVDRIDGWRSDNMVSEL